MNAEDDDIIEVYRVDHVPELTRERAIQIRDSILGEGTEGDASGSMSPKCRSSDSKRKRDSEMDDEAPGVKRSSPLKTPERSPKRMTNHSKSDRSPVKTPVKNGDVESPVNGTVRLSPRIIKARKKFKIKDLDPVVKSTNELESSGVDYSEFFTVDLTVDEHKEIKFSDSSGRYSASLRKIVQHELDNQAGLREMSAVDGTAFSELLLAEEVKRIRDLFALPDDACKLFARMLCRKKTWHRVSTVTYDDISDRIEDVFRKLEKAGYVDFDISKESIEVQLGFLSKKDIQELCKKMNVKAAPQLKKQDMIEVLVKSCRTQRSALDLWKKDDGSTGRVAVLKRKVDSVLGTCVQINGTVLEIFDRLLLLFSLTHNVLEDDKWSTQIRMVIESDYQPYPKYEVNPSVIFRTREDFLLYKAAVKLMWDINVALEQKNTNDFSVVEGEAKKMFDNLLKDTEYKERLSGLPPFLRRYSAGCVCARILTICCDKNKKLRNPDEVINMITTLVHQRTFLPGKRGLWFSSLSQAYMKTNRITEAASSLVQGLRDKGLDEVQRLELQLKGQRLLKMKMAEELQESELGKELAELCRSDVEDPIEVKIVANSLSGNCSGYKAVYMEEVGDGDKVYSSVEEYAINYYKRDGFTKGVHCEGFIIQTIYSLLFFDIIYDSSVPGVFQSPYQEAPLDFWSKSFYENRKDLIDYRLAEIRNWTESEIAASVEESYKANRGLRCIISWNDNYTPEIFSEIIHCLGSSAVASICERLASHYKVFSPGFPDLTVWNPTSRRYKFVEVKSHNDKLSARQRVWLHYLRTIGVNCEVLMVKNKSSKAK